MGKNRILTLNKIKTPEPITNLAVNSDTAPLRLFSVGHTDLYIKSSFK